MFAKRVCIKLIKDSRSIYQMSKVYNFHKQAEPYIADKKFYKDEILPKILPNRNIKTNDDWKNLRQEILHASNNVINDINIDAQMIGYYINQKNYDLAYSYIEFLKNENMNLNLACVGKYFTLFSNVHQEKISEKNEEHIMSVYTDLRKIYKILDTITCESAIEALSLTKHWKECFKLLKEIKVVTVPSVKAYSASASAAFKNNDDNLGWNTLEEMLENNRNPSNSVYIAYLNRYIKPNLNDLKDMETLLYFLKYNDIKVDEEVATKLAKIFNAIRYSSSLTMVTNKGICKACKKTLKKLHVTDEEFNSLKKEFFDNVIIGKNVFYKTSPEEVNRFKNFLTNLKNIDVVIDGLNVAYSSGVKQTSYVCSSLVAAVVKHFVTLNKNVLVLGRLHMNRWPKHNLSYITKNANVFLTEDLSQDDPYLLYCALSAGLHTIVVSRDLMRSHKYLLKTAQQRSIFSRWYAQNQYQLLHINNAGNPFFKFPLPYMRTAQEHGESWHIPYENSPPGKGQINYEWLCLRKL